MQTPSQEDYLEAIWVLVQSKGYARVTDLAEYLHIRPASVSHMVKRLHEEGLLAYERYRGFAFTPSGAVMGRRLLARHKTLERFLTVMGVEPPERVYAVVEGIEHHVDMDVAHRLGVFADYANAHPAWWHEFRKMLDDQSPGGDSP